MVASAPHHQPQPQDALLGVTMAEFIEGQLPALAAYERELETFALACRAHIAAAARPSSGPPAAATLRLKRQAARDYDVLVLAGWWNELLAQQERLNALLMASRAELREAAPSRSLARARVCHAAQRYLQRVQDVTYAARDELRAVHNSTEGERLGALSHVLAVASPEATGLWYGETVEEEREAPPAREAEWSATSSELEQQPLERRDEPLREEARVELESDTLSTAESQPVRDEPREEEPAVEYRPKPDLSPLRHTTLDASSRIVPILNADLSPMLSTHGASPQRIDPVGEAIPRSPCPPDVSVDPVRMAEELAVPPGWSRRHGEYVAMERLEERDGVQSRESGAWGWRLEQEQSAAEAAEEQALMEEGGERLTVPHWSQAMLADC